MSKWLVKSGSYKKLARLAVREAQIKNLSVNKI